MTCLVREVRYITRATVNALPLGEDDFNYLNTFLMRIEAFLITMGDPNVY